jgi:micrococcal nuclease
LRLQSFGILGLLLAAILLLTLACGGGEQQAGRQKPEVVTVTKEVTEEEAEDETDSASKANTATETKESDVEGESSLKKGLGSSSGDSGSEEAAVEEAIRGHYEAIGDGNFEQAYSYFGPTFRNATEEEVWIEEEKSFDITSSTVHSVEVEEVSEPTATATVDVSFEDNTGIPRFLITWNLLKESGEWKLDNQASAETLTNPEPAPKPEPTLDDTQDSSGKEVTVVEVVDGDTVEISPVVDGISSVRLIGVDTPETSSECGKQPYANQATLFTESKLEGRSVELEFDAERVDPYERLLAYIYKPNGSMFNETLLEEGYAQVYTVPPNVKYEVRFLEAQQETKAAERGLWGLPSSKQRLQNDRGNGIGGGCVVQPEPQPKPEREPKPERTPRPEPKPRPGQPSGGLPPLPPDGDYDCDDLTHAQAQRILRDDPSDPHDLDGAPEDGIACES